MTQDFMIPFSSKGYRLTLALYGAGAFMITASLATRNDPVIYELLGDKAAMRKGQPPIYLWGFKVLWLALPIFLFLLFAPQIARALRSLKPRNSESFAIFEFLGFSIISALSFLDFGINPSLALQFIGYSFILAATDYLRGFSLNFSFASDPRILREARMEKLKLLHKKWFSGISALVTVAVAICITGVLRLYDVWRQDFGIKASEILLQMLMTVIMYAGAGLVLGPFAHLLNFLGIIEDQFERIESSPEPPVATSRDRTSTSGEKQRTHSKTATRRSQAG